MVAVFEGNSLFVTYDGFRLYMDIYFDVTIHDGLYSICENVREHLEIQYAFCHSVKGPCAPHKPMGELRKGYNISKLHLKMCYRERAAARFSIIFFLDNGSPIGQCVQFNWF